MDGKIINGEVWINGERTSAKLAPYFVERGISLQNHDKGFGGPHTFVYVSPVEFDSYIGDGVNKTICVDIEKVDIGHIDECNGYAALDVGSHTRKINKLAMSIARIPGVTKFSFDGTTGLLEPNSVSGGLTPTQQKAKGFYEFSIWFEIADQDFAACFRTDLALAAMARLSRLGEIVSG